jgi:type II secretory pathway predicted ATPase ExeA
MMTANASAAGSFAQAVSRAREEYAMYEEYYGFVEKPFSLTPDPKYLYRSESHANAFELLQYAIRRREGFVVVTGDIGTGKTTLCRAVLEQLDRKTFTALILNPFLAEEDLLRLILQDFGVVSREEIKRGRLAGVSKQELIETLNDFLLSLLPLRATAVLIIDEAQNLPRAVLEHIRILSNLETDKEKLLQIVLVGQLNLREVLRSPDLRQLDQRVSIRYNLKPLTQEETAAYVAHRLTIAGGGSAVSPFDNVKVRQAIAYAVPYQKIMDAVMFGLAKPMFGGSGATEVAWPQPTGYDTDIAKAKALLAEAGHGDGFETTLSFDLGFGVIGEPLAVLVQESLAAIGIKATINKIPGANWRSELTKKELPMIVNFFSGWLDYPEYFLFWCYHGQNALFNTMSYQNPAMDALIEGARKASAEGDLAAYEKDVKGFVDLAFTDVPRIPLFQPYLSVAMQKNISGYQYWFHRQLDYRTIVKG